MSTVPQPGLRGAARGTAFRFVSCENSKSASVLHLKSRSRLNRQRMLFESLIPSQTPKEALLSFLFFRDVSDWPALLDGDKAWTERVVKLHPAYPGTDQEQRPHRLAFLRGQMQAVDLAHIQPPNGMGLACLDKAKATRRGEIVQHGSLWSASNSCGSSSIARRALHLLSEPKANQLANFGESQRWRCNHRWPFQDLGLSDFVPFAASLNSVLSLRPSWALHPFGL
jgi:hypothetical protein